MANNLVPVTSATFRYDVNASGVITSGDVTQTKAPAEQGASAFPDMAFTGHYYHARSGLYLAPYRAYNPSIGRWLSRDPLEDAEEVQGTNLYSYVANQPLARVDPDGRKWIGWGPLGAPSFQSVSVQSPYPEGGRCPAVEGWYRHCVNTCLLRRRIGRLNGLFGIGFAVAEFGAELHGGDLPFQRSRDPGDIAANMAGHDAAWARGSCEEECRKRHPSRNGGR